MDDLRIIPVVNEELVLSVAAMADEIWHEHYDKLLGSGQVDYMVEKFLSPDALCEQINNGYEYFLISHEYTFAGFAGILENEQDKSLFLSKLYIHEESRGKHISTEMLKKFIELCELRGLTKIWLTCNRHNSHSLDIYKHWGFEIIREECTDIGNGYVMDDYILELKIE